MVRAERATQARIVHGMSFVCDRSYVAVLAPATSPGHLRGSRVEQGDLCRGKSQTLSCSLGLDPPQAHRGRMATALDTTNDVVAPPPALALSSGADGWCERNGPHRREHVCT